MAQQIKVARKPAYETQKVQNPEGLVAAHIEVTRAEEKLEAVISRAKALSMSIQMGLRRSHNGDLRDWGTAVCNLACERAGGLIRLMESACPWRMPIDCSEDFDLVVGERLMDSCLDRTESLESQVADLEKSFDQMMAALVAGDCGAVGIFSKRVLGLHASLTKKTRGVLSEQPWEGSERPETMKSKLRLEIDEDECMEDLFDLHPEDLNCLQEIC